MKAKGFWDSDPFDFNNDGEVDAGEFALGMMIMEDIFGDDHRRDNRRYNGRYGGCDNGYDDDEE